MWLKREDLAHTGAHKINNGIGQALLAKALGAKRVVAETGAGQHGVAAAAACARVGLPCTVYMGEIDVARQAPNVDRMRRFGATVVAVKSGDRTLRAAIDEAIRDWVSDPVGTYYLLGSAIGPHPYPYLVRELQAVIGREARAQMLERSRRPARRRVRLRRRRLATRSVCSTAFLADRGVKLFGVEAGGRGAALGEHSATLSVRQARRAARHAHDAACTTSTARSRRRIRSPRGSTIPASARSTRCCKPSAASST